MKVWNKIKRLAACTCVLVMAAGAVLLVMRPYQIYAVKMAYDRVKGCHLSGFVHHTTGSGKTLTSFKLATLLRDDSHIEKVFFLIDRKDLDDQTVDEYNSFELGCVDNTPSTKRLVADIEDSTKTMIITTIQKMATALHKEKYAKVMDKLKSPQIASPPKDHVPRERDGICNPLLRNINCFNSVSSRHFPILSLRLT